MELEKRNFSVYELNTPYMELSKMLTSEERRISSLRKKSIDDIYFISKIVSIKTDGIKDKLEVDYFSSLIKLMFGITIYASDFTKDNSNSNILNIDELYTHMNDDGFLMLENVYSENINISSFPISTFISKSDMDSIAVGISSSEFELINKFIIESVVTPESFISEDTFLGEFLSKDESIDSIDVFSDNISSVTVKDATSSKFYASSSYMYASGDAVTYEFMMNNYILISSLAETDGLKIETVDSGQHVANVESISVYGENYIDAESPEIFHIKSTRDINTEVSDDDILSSDEVLQLFEEKLKDLLGKSITSIESFSDYINGLCLSGDEYVPKDLDFGRVIYGGTTLQNGYSLVNVDASKFNLSPYGITQGTIVGEAGENGGSPDLFNVQIFHGMEKELDVVSEYFTQLYKKEIDIIGFTNSEMQEFLASLTWQLSNLSSVNIPIEEINIDLDEITKHRFYLPLNIYTLLPLETISIIPSIIIPRYIKIINIHLYIPLDQYSFYNTQPQIIYPNITFAQYIPTVQVPMIPLGDVTSVVFNNTLNMPSMSPFNPILPDPKDYLISNSDRDDYYIVFLCEERDFKSRYVVNSKRHFNMTEVLLLLKYIDDVLTDDYYFIDVCEDIFVSKDYYSLRILSLALREAMKESEMRFTFDLELFELMDFGTIDDDSLDESDASGDSACLYRSPIKDDSYVYRSFDTIEELVGESFDGTLSYSNTEIIPSPSTIGLNGFEMQYSKDEGKFREIVDALKLFIVNHTNSYVENKILRREYDVMNSDDYTVSEFNEISVGDILIDYTSIVPAVVGYSYSPDVRGVFSSVGSFSGKKNIKEVVHPFQAITFGPTTPERVRRYEVVGAIPGEARFAIWDILSAQDEVELESLKVLSINDDILAVIDVYGKSIFISMDSNFYYAVGEEFSPVLTTETIGNQEKEILTVGSKRLIMPMMNRESRDIVEDHKDDWISPNAILGAYSAYMFVGDPGFFNSTHMEQDMMTGGIRDTGEFITQNMISYPEYLGQEASGTVTSMFYDADYVDISSGVPLDIVENISSLESLDPNAPEQEEGTVPGAYTSSLSLTLRKYAPYINEGKVIDAVEIYRVNINLVLGVIDGIQDVNGDILAQGYSQEELPSEVDAPIMYVKPHKVLLDYYETRPYVSPKDESIEGFIHAIDLRTLIGEQLMRIDMNDTATTFYNVLTNRFEVGEVRIDTDYSEATSPLKAGDLIVTDIKTKGVSFTYKHAGQDPVLPIIRGYYGSSEVDFIDGKRLVGTMPSPIPDTFVLEGVKTAEEFLSEIDLSSFQIIFMLSENKLEAFCKNTGAILSENRTITTNVVK